MIKNILVRQNKVFVQSKVDLTTQSTAVLKTVKNNF